MIMHMQMSGVAVLTIYIYYIYTVHTTFCIHIVIGKGTTSTAASHDVPCNRVQTKQRASQHFVHGASSARTEPKP
jgi:hypothetical protein